MALLTIPTLAHAPLLLRLRAPDAYEIAVEAGERGRLTVGRIMLVARSSGRSAFTWTVTGPKAPSAAVALAGEADSLDNAKADFRRTFDRLLAWADHERGGHAGACGCALDGGGTRAEKLGQGFTQWNRTHRYWLVKAELHPAICPRRWPPNRCGLRTRPHLFCRLSVRRRRAPSEALQPYPPEEMAPMKVVKTVKPITRGKKVQTTELNSLVYEYQSVHSVRH